MRRGPRTVPAAEAGRPAGRSVRPHDLSRHRDARPRQALRRPSGARLHRPRGAARLRVRLPRPQRRRQDDAHPAPPWPRPADERPHAPARPRPPGGRAAALARVGAIIEEPRFHPLPHGPREPPRPRGGARPRRAGRVDAALERVGLAAAATTAWGRTRSACASGSASPAACCAIRSCSILDEPVNGLDPAGILEFRGLVRSLVAEGRTVCFPRTCSTRSRDLRRRRHRRPGPRRRPGDDRRAAGGSGRAIDIVAAARSARRRRARRRTGGPARGRAPGAIRVELAPEAPADSEMVTELLRRLLADGIAIERVSPVTGTLEDRFLDMTTRLEDRG